MTKTIFDMMPLYNEKRKRLAELLGWTNIELGDFLGIKTWMGCPPDTVAGTTATMMIPDWIGDWDDIGELMIDGRITPTFSSDKANIHVVIWPEYRPGEVGTAIVIVVDIDDHSSTTTAFHFAVVTAAIAQLEHIASQPPSGK